MKYSLAHLLLSQATKPHVTVSGGEDGNRGVALIAGALFVAAIFAVGFYLGRKTSHRK
jgi:hypothetical protein